MSRFLIPAGKPAVLALLVAAGLVLTATPTPAHADPDSDFTNQLHTYGIYGQEDYNAWIAKITCKRLHNGLDTEASQSADFVSKQLDRHSSTGQIWQFLGLALTTYCPDQLPVLHRAAAKPAT